MSATALLIIDVQKGMFTHKEQPHEGNLLLARISGMVERARNAHVPVIFVQHDGGAGHTFEKPTEGWQLHPGTGYRHADVVVEKRYCDAFQETPLHAHLQTNKVSRIIIAGMQTEYCIDTSCRRAFSLGYEVILASNAHSTFSNSALSAAQIIAHHNMVLGDNFAILRAAEDIDFQHGEK